MARPSKATAVLQSEGKSHRTKAEIESRKEAENAALTGKKISAREDTKSNPEAYKEFRRMRRLLDAIGKNDALYEVVINRYCVLYAECLDFSRLKKEFMDSKEELQEEYRSGQADESVSGGLKPSAYYRLLATMQNNILALDKQIIVKQKMMLDIEKEFAMTVSSSMRAIPKTTEKKANPLLDALNDED